MRDMNRVRDKIEIRLEPRQIALLVVATMVFSGGLFGGGYYLGLRGAPPPAVEPNLTTIDAATAEVAPAVEATAPSPAALGEVEFLFPSLLGSRPARKKARAYRPARPAPKAPTIKAPVAKAPIAKAPATQAPVAVRPELAVKPAVVAPEPPEPEVIVEKPAPVVVAPASVAERPAPVAVAPEPPEPEVIVEKPAPVVVAPAPVTPTPAVAAERPAAPPVVVLSAAPRPAPVVEPPEPEVRVDEDAPPVAPKPKYTLQVKALRTRGEVDEFAATMRRMGFKPSVILANVPGKGRVYRVRLGRFTSRAEARRFQRQYKRRSKLPDGGFVTDL